MLPTPESQKRLSLLMNDKKIKKYFTGYLTSGPRGLKTIISKGNKVKLLKSATTMAIPVRKPKYIVGIKLDKVRTENPTVTVMEV